MNNQGINNNDEFTKKLYSVGGWGGLRVNPAIPLSKFQTQTNNNVFVYNFVILFVVI